MEQKEFLNLTAKLLKDYGFVKIGNQFFLNLDRVVIRVYRYGARFVTGEYLYYFNICLKEIYEEYVFETKEDYKNMPEDFGVLKNIEVDELLENKIYKNKQFNPKDYTTERWVDIFTKALHETFDSFKSDLNNLIESKYSPENLGITITAKKELIKRNLIFTK